jgi:hypothetical protein
MKTSIAKTKAGWQGNTRIEMGGNRILRIVTGKDQDGGLTTTAWVHHVETTSGYRAEVHRARADFAKRMVYWNVRVTEKQVRAQHELALDMLNDLFEAIGKHYLVDKG